MAERFIEIIEENKVGGKSVPSYYGFDGKSRYLNAYESVSEAQNAPQLKTINEQSIKGSGNISIVTDVPVVTVSGATPTQKLMANTFYRFGTVDSLTLTKELPTVGKLCIYAFSFTAGDSFDASTDITWPDGVVLDREMELETGQFCEVSILDDHATFVAWPAPETSEEETT